MTFDMGQIAKVSRFKIRKGAYKGMLNNRKFTIVLQDGTRKVVDYKGKRVSVKF